MNAKFKVSLSARKVREMCIRCDFYTCGDNEAYSKMLGMCHEDMTPDEVLKIAQDIVAHSDPDNEVLSEGDAECMALLYLGFELETQVEVPISMTPPRPIRSGTTYRR